MRISPIFQLATMLLLAVRSVEAVSQPHPFGDGTSDKTASPYFKVNNADAGADTLPLKATHVKAVISGAIADVTVEQTYANAGKVPIEAIYVFPASTRAAVHGAEMHIGPRVIKAKIEERSQAQATYDKAKSENKTATLLEQHRPNVFQMSVANILPGDEVRVLLHYSEKLSATERIYEFVFPTVVGPRYSDPSVSKEKWVQNPYLSEGIATPSTFAVEVELRAGMPLQMLDCPSHESQAQIHFQGKETASVQLTPNGEAANRDFVLHYQLADRQVASGLLLHKGTDENFFLLNVQPPARVTPDQIPPRDYLFILDVSGSMSTFPINTAKVLMKDLLQGLKPTDTFNIMLFSGDNKVLSEAPLPATADNIESGLSLIQIASAAGATELVPALSRALKMPDREGVSRSIVVITDGYVDIEKQAFQLVRTQLHHANVFAFGIGTAVNRWLIEGLAQAGQGEPFVVSSAQEAAGAAARFRQYVSSPVLTHIEVHYDGFTAEDTLPASIPDVFADRPIELIGKWKGEAKGRVTLTGMGGGGPYTASFDVAAEAARSGLSNPALRPLWAREKVRSLESDAGVNPRAASSDSRNGPMETGFAEDGETARQITALGIGYELLTSHTSFVGVDETPRALLTDAQTVHQPLPLPLGVTNSAINGGSGQVVYGNSSTHTGTTPEPGTWWLFILGGVSLLFQRRRKVRP